MYSSDQLLELFVVICTADHYRYIFSKIAEYSFLARSKSGPVRSDSMPTRLSLYISPIQKLVHFIVPSIYILSVVGAGFDQPQWMRPLALPDVWYGLPLQGFWKNALRVLACISSTALQSVSDAAFAELNDQFHPIGRREKSRIVRTGPYAWVRHPLYAVSLLQVSLWTLMFWSYLALFAVVGEAIAFFVKIPIEEEIVLQDEAVKEEYRAYMHKVPTKLVPFIW